MMAVSQTLLSRSFVKVLDLERLTEQPFLIRNTAARTANVLRFANVLDVSRRVVLE